LQVSEIQKYDALAQESNTFSIIDVRLSPDDVSPALQRLSDLFAKSLKG
jgi:indolepyruvate decarboxylase